MFKRILIANRGEIAMRVIRAAEKLGVETVAVYSKADRHSPHLKYATKSVCIGPSQSKSSYLKMEAILQAALQYECQAIHPGYGFLAENALFANLCQQYNIAFIGPSATSIATMGDKAQARITMEKAGLPTIPGSKTIIANVEEALQIAEEIGYPVLLKATAGGGGKGMRICATKEELPGQFEEASMEAEKAFGNAGLYMEKYIAAGSHIEFQVLGDQYGNAVHLGERECSVQRRHQKLIEESPSPKISAELREKTGNLVTKAMRQIGYQNAGTIEFLMDENQNLYFMEMNTRLQVEHPVTEMITDTDLVSEQLKVAAACPLQIDTPAFTGHAIECRINAEDSDQDFRPSPGQITTLKFPEQNDNVRIDTYIEEGYSIPPFYDSMICKVIVHEKDRSSAIEKMKAVLEEIQIEGVPTTIPALQKILQLPDFVSGDYDTKITSQLGY